MIHIFIFNINSVQTIVLSRRTKKRKRRRTKKKETTVAHSDTHSTHKSTKETQTTTYTPQQQHQHQQHQRQQQKMGFALLAVVEIQLIMQCCDFKTLLRLARTCHLAHNGAMSKFAWRKVPATLISWAYDHNNNNNKDVEAMESSLLRFGGTVALKWLPPLLSSDSTRSIDDSHALNACFTNTSATVVSLDARSRNEMNAEDCARLPMLSIFRKLRALYMPSFGGNDYRASFCQALATHIPDIEKLSVQWSQHWFPCAHDLTPLSQLQHLTDLEVRGSPEGIEACERLKTLSITTLNARQCGITEVLTSPHLRTVESLSITFAIRGNSQHTLLSWMDIFNNLCSLTSFTLRDAICIDAVVEALCTRGQALRTLRFASDLKFHCLKASLPSTRQMIDVLTQLSHLHTLQIEMPRNATHAPEDFSDFCILENFNEHGRYINAINTIVRPAFPSKTIQLFDYNHPSKLLSD